MIRRIELASLLVGGTLIVAAGIAAADHPPPHAPPREAVEACQKLKAGDACAVRFDSRTIDGTCRAAPDGQGPLACVPKGPPPEPPPEAFEACRDLAAGDACTVNCGDHTLDGVCRSGPDGKGRLACAPNGPPPHAR